MCLNGVVIGSVLIRHRHNKTLRELLHPPSVIALIAAVAFIVLRRVVVLPIAISGRTSVAPTFWAYALLSCHRENAPDSHHQGYLVDAGITFLVENIRNK
jgi:hypothetical protein